MDFINDSDMYIPGGGVENGIISIKLNHKSKLTRLAFNFRTPQVVSKSNDFVFGYFTDKPDLIGADILAGDIGFPEIHVVNDLGQIYRFKRGNIKDFLSPSKLNELQEVRLPYSSFIFNIDLKTNVVSDIDFFTRPIVKISFDFLSNPEHDVNLTIVNPRLESSTPSLLNCFDLLNIEGTNKLNGLPIFVTESHNLSLSLSKKDICDHLYPSDLVVKYSAEVENKLLVSIEKSIDSKIYIQIPAKKFGPSKLNFSLIYKGSVIAESSLSIIRTLPKSTSNETKLGVSDARFYGDIDRLGGTFSRVVLNLSSIQRDGSTYKFSPNCNILSLLNNSSSRKIIVALKGMPRWLSDKSDSYDFYRYAPESFDEYRELVKWIIEELVNIKVFALETWNEANVIHEWNDSFDVLLSMHKIIYEESKKIDNEFLVLSPSSTSWDFDYFDMLLKKGFYKYSDGLAMHAYSYSPCSHQDLFEKLESVGLKCQKENPEFGIYITEVGFRTPSYTDEEQALYLALFSLQTHFREIFKSIVWFRYQNTSSELLGSYSQNSSGGYSMVGYQGLYARPMFAAYRFLDNIFSELIPLKIINDNESTLFVGKYRNEKFVASFCEKKQHNLFRQHGDVKKELINVYGQTVNYDSYCDIDLLFQLSESSEMKIGFFGASVTAQGFNHKTKEVVGWREVLSSKLRSDFNVFEDFSYPGNRFSDAGLIKLQEIIESKPEICLVEPLIEDNTRGVKATIEEIYYFYNSLLMSGIYPVTIFLPNPKTGDCKSWDNYSNFKKINNDFNLPVIEIEITEINDGFYFNGVHTTSKGAVLYGDKIYNKLYEIIKKGIPECVSYEEVNNVFVTRLVGTKKNELLSRKLVLCGEGRFKIVQKAKIGPYSPILSCKRTVELESYRSEISLWDPYCHYVRTAYSILSAPIDFEKKTTTLEFSISDTLPEYTKCRRDNMIWPMNSELKLVPLEDAYIISNNNIGYSFIN